MHNKLEVQLEWIIETFEKYLSSNNKDYEAEVLIRLGYLYIENNQINEAINIFEKYLAGETKDHFLEIKMRLAYLYVETKQFFLAIALFEQVLQNPIPSKQKSFKNSFSTLQRKFIRRKI